MAAPPNENVLVGDVLAGGSEVGAEFVFVGVDLVCRAVEEIQEKIGGQLHKTSDKRVSE